MSGGFDTHGPLGVLGGTFDPVHVGHLRLAIEVRERLGLAAVHLVPLHLPPHRALPHAAPALRLAMLQAGLKHAAGLHVDDREVRRGGVSYTYDTLSALRTEQPSRPLCLILGQDAFAQLPTWYRWTELLTLGHIVVVARPGTTREVSPLLQSLIEETSTMDKRRLRQETAGCIYFLDCPLLEISSSAIRAMIAAGCDPRFLIPEGALDLVFQHNLYLKQTS